MKVIQKIASVFLAAVFLFSSLGFTISSMVCLKSEKAKVSMALIEDCCTSNDIEFNKTACCEDEQELASSENVTLIEKDDCCEINNFTLQLNDFQNTQKLALEKPVVIQSIFSSSEIALLAKTENKLPFQYTDTSPPLHGRTLLNFISTLVI